MKSFTGSGAKRPPSKQSAIPKEKSETVKSRAITGEDRKELGGLAKKEPKSGLQPKPRIAPSGSKYGKPMQDGYEDEEMKKPLPSSMAKKPIGGKEKIIPSRAPPSYDEPMDGMPPKHSANPVKDLSKVKSKISGGPFGGAAVVKDTRKIQPAKGPTMPLEETAEVTTEGCQYCGRKFNPVSLEKHEKVCLERPDKKKRKVFDSAKLRIVDSEQKELMAYSKKKEVKKGPPKKGGATGKVPNKWKIESLQFRAAMQAARGPPTKGPSGKGGKGAAIDPVYDEYAMAKVGFKECPNCGRSFNETAAQKHFPFCAAKAKNAKMTMPQRGKAPTISKKR